MLSFSIPKVYYLWLSEDLSLNHELASDNLISYQGNLYDTTYMH